MPAPPKEIRTLLDAFMEDDADASSAK